MTSDTPTCAVLIIGNEILSGRTADANLGYIARRCDEIGLHLAESRIVRDVEEDIIAAINALRARYTYVFTTGGIGPTHDDITIESIAKAFGVPVERNEQVAAELTARYADRMTPAVLKMADFPNGARLIANAVTYAPGCAVGNVFVFAGIPRIMQSMFEATVPLLRVGKPMHSRSIDAYISESTLSIPFEQIQAENPQVELGSYPFRTGERSGTSLVCRGRDARQVEKAFSSVEMMLDTLGAEKRV